MKFLKDNRILEIKEAEPTEAAEILEYLKKVGSETTNLLIDENGIGLTVEQEEKHIETSNAKLNTKIFVGRVEGNIVSVAGINGSDRKRIEHNATLGISVLKDFWNVGVGGHMMNHILNYCRMTKEILNVNLEVREDNEKAIKLYEKLGFKQVGKLTKKIKVDGKFYDELIYEIAV